LNIPSAHLSLALLGHIKDEKPSNEVIVAKFLLLDEQNPSSELQVDHPS